MEKDKTIERRPRVLFELARDWWDTFGDTFPFQFYQ